MNSLKQFFLLSFCAAFCLAAQAQESDTGQQSGWKTSAGWEFAPVGAKWCYFDQYRTPRHNEGFLLMECVKDTVISNLPMREIARKYVDIYRDGADPTVSQTESFFVHCREDSVYIHNPETGGLDLLYVFNAQPGDTLGLTVPYYADYATPGWAFSIRIDDVTTKDMGGVPVKAYSNSICEGETGFYSTLYDYVGSASMFFPVSVVPGTGTHFLASYYDPVVGRLQFADVKSVMKYYPWDVYPWDIEDWLMGEDDNYPWGVGEVPGQPGAEVRVTYSPEERRLTVERPGQGADGCRTALFTDRGVQALEFAGAEADLSLLPAGIYLVQVRDGKGGAVLHTGKIQVQ